MAKRLHTTRPRLVKNPATLSKHQTHQARSSAMDGFVRVPLREGNAFTDTDVCRRVRTKCTPRNNYHAPDLIRSSPGQAPSLMSAGSLLGIAIVIDFKVHTIFTLIRFSKPTETYLCYPREQAQFLLQLAPAVAP